MSRSPSDPVNAQEKPVRVVRVLVVSPLPPPSGGIASWTQMLADRGIGDGFDLKIVDTSMTGSQTIGRKATLGFSEIFRSIRIIVSLIFSLLTWRPDVVHVNSSLSPTGVFRDAAVSVIVRVFLLKYVVNLRGEFVIPAGGFRGSLTRLAYRAMLRPASLVVPLSPLGARNVQAMGVDYSKIRRINNFIDPSLFVPNTAPAYGKLRVVFVGQLMDSKGLEVIRQISRRMAGIKLDLVGPSPHMNLDVFRAEFAAGEVISEVTVHGELDRSQVFEILARSHVFLLPSRTEGFPLAVAEAMASGLVIVASDVGALPEMVAQPLGGFVHKPDDVDSFIESLLKLSTSPETRAEIGKRNREVAVREYDFHAVMADWQSVYRFIGKG